MNLHRIQELQAKKQYLLAWKRNMRPGSDAIANVNQMLEQIKSELVILREYFESQAQPNEMPTSNHSEYS